MYTEHPAFSSPEDNSVLWRYMDFTKFVSVLDKKALFFVLPNRLGDPFEGAFPMRNKDLNFKAFYEAFNKQMSEEDFRELRDFQKDWHRYSLISCWHESSHESAAMWKSYSRETDGIAIRTDFNSFKRSLISPQDIYVGKVNYIDYESHVIPESNAFYPLLHKRQDFKYEEEVRAITTMLPKSEEEINQPLDICDVGKYYEVDLSLLIKAIVVAPYADDWFLELVQSVVANLYKLDVPVVKSNLAQKPIWD